MSSSLENRQDGALINVMTGMGGENDTTQYTRVGTAPRLSDRALEELACVWPLNKVCTAYPDAATGKGWEVTWPEGTDQKVIEAFDTYRAVIGTRTKTSDLRDQELASDVSLFRQALYLANVYRGSALVLNIDDGRHPSEPVDTQNIRTIKECEVLDSCDIFPDITQVSDPLKATHYNLAISPQFYPAVRQMFDQGRVGRSTYGYYSYSIHRSRVLRFPGSPIPTKKKHFNNGWDGALIETVWDKFVAWEEVGNAIQNLISDYSLFIYSLQGLADKVASGGEEVLRTRINTFRVAAKVLGGLVVDQDKEKVEFLTRQFGGLESLRTQFREDFIGATGIPHTILFGESPSGLGATGESEEKTWAAQVGSYQNNIVLPNLMRLYQLVFLANDGPTQGKPLKGWGVKFPSLLVQSEAEILGNRSTQAQTDNTYKDMGVLTTAEIRDSRFGGSEYSHETNLDQATWEAEQAQQSEGGDPNANPDQESDPTEPPPEVEAESLSLAELQGMRGDSLRLLGSADFPDAQLYRRAKQRMPFRQDSRYGQFLLRQTYRRMSNR